MMFAEVFFFLFSALALLDAVELEGAEEGDAEGDGDGLPFDGGAAPGGT